MKKSFSKLQLAKMRQDFRLSLVKRLKSPPVSGPTNTDTDTIGCSLGRRSSTNLFSSSIEPDEGKKNLKKVSRKLKKMSDEDLRMLFSPKDDNFVYDCIIDNIPMVSELQQERDNLQQQVSDLAKFNHAREPEFARDRKKLRDTIDDVEHLKHRVASGSMLPILNILGQAQGIVTETLRIYERKSELIKDQFAPLQFTAEQKVYDDQKDFDELIEQYINVRKEAIRWGQKAKRIEFNREKINLEANVPKPLAPTSSLLPIPPRRQRKRVSFNK